MTQADPAPNADCVPPNPIEASSRSEAVRCSCPSPLDLPATSTTAAGAPLTPTPSDPRFVAALPNRFSGAFTVIADPLFDRNDTPVSGLPAMSTLSAIDTPPPLLLMLGANTGPLHQSVPIWDEGFSYMSYSSDMAVSPVPCASVWYAVLLAAPFHCTCSVPGPVPTKHSTMNGTAPAPICCVKVAVVVELPDCSDQESTTFRLPSHTRTPSLKVTWKV